MKLLFNQSFSGSGLTRLFNTMSQYSTFKKGFSDEGLAQRAYLKSQNEQNPPKVRRFCNDVALARLSTPKTEKSALSEFWYLYRSVMIIRRFERLKDQAIRGDYTLIAAMRMRGFTTLVGRNKVTAVKDYLIALLQVTPQAFGNNI